VVAGGHSLLLTATYLEKKIRRFVELIRQRSFSFYRVNPTIDQNKPSD